MLLSFKIHDRRITLYTDVRLCANIRMWRWSYILTPFPNTIEYI